MKIIYKTILITCILFSVQIYSQSHKIVHNSFSSYIPINYNIKTSGPQISYIGYINPVYSSIIEKAYINSNDDINYLYFKLSIADEDSNNIFLIRINKNESKDKLFVSSDIDSQLPDSLIELALFSNYREGEDNTYPYINKWKISNNYFIHSYTYKGCIDTDRANIHILKDTNELAILSNLGWISFIKHDFDFNGADDILLISNKFCEVKMEFYLIIF